MIRDGTNDVLDKDDLINLRKKSLIPKEKVFHAQSMPFGGRNELFMCAITGEESLQCSQLHILCAS